MQIISVYAFSKHFDFALLLQAKQEEGAGGVTAEMSRQKPQAVGIFYICVRGRKGVGGRDICRRILACANVAAGGGCVVR